MEKNFNERRNENERNNALVYINHLLDVAQLDKQNDRQNDITQLLEVQRLLEQKKYGIIWEEHIEKVDENMKTEIPVFEEITSKKITDSLQDSPYNFLLVGDNLHSLHILEKTHTKKIDVIYIDPPYNTGSKDFIYNDKVVDNKDTWKHSKWLSFMKNRLLIARKLLAEDGVIFISIGDDEQAQLKLLMNELFGEKNFIGQIARTSKTTSFRGNYFAPSKDYILAYARNTNLLKKFSDEVDTSQYKKKETQGPRKGQLYRDDTAFYLSTLQTRPNQRYYIISPDGEKLLPPGQTFPPEKPISGDGVWRWNYNSFCEKRDYIVFKKSKRSPLITSKGEKAHWNVYTKSYLAEKKKSGNLPRDIFQKFLNRAGSADLKKLGITFDFPKPVSLIKYLLKIINKPNATVLDFFAGSGTTGQAVTELNYEDSGSRRFILATNNDNDIADNVTYPRIKKVSKGTDKYKAKPLNLKYFNTRFINKKTKNLEEELLKNIKALVELQNHVDIENSKCALVLTKDEAVKLDINNISVVYMRGRVRRMLSVAQQNRYANINIIDIPEVYFSKELGGWI